MIPAASVQHVLDELTPQVDVEASLLEELLRTQPTGPALMPYLNADAPRSVRAAVAYLAVQATARDADLLAGLLHHDDAGVAELAEYGLWNLWMQSGTVEGNRAVADAVIQLRRGFSARAVETLRALVRSEPRFAEAHFQLGLALEASGDSSAAADAYRRALRLNRHHFAAAMALGNLCVEQFNRAGALHFYRTALAIHPRLEGVAEAVRELAGPSSGSV